MAFEKPSPVTALTQELRFATTMTGGVSLAIWMAGVTREINLLAQASQWRRLGGTFPTNSQLTNESAASLRLYAQLIDLLDMVVDVDILSGTSAGGINAALLASSRVTGSDLGGIRDLWLDLGALTELLRDPRDKKTPSLLYGDERIFAALAKRLPKLATGPFPPTTFPEAARTPSTTLYITTTLLAGETSRFTDSFGTLVQDVDRRGLFTFTETDLARPDTAPALALAARSSASFPLAFEPSFLPFTKGTAKKGEVPARPAMAPFTSLTRPHWVSDGGLLDNRPIGVLFKRIFDRPARRPVRRVLLFVVPSSGPAPDPMHEPSWIGSSAGLMVAAASPYVAWMSVTAGQAELTAAQVRVAAAAYETAYGLTVPPPVIAENRAELMILIATNLLGQNTPAIAVNEAEYGEMWAQDAAAMFGYAATAATATEALLPFEDAPLITNPGGLLEQAVAVEEAIDTAAANQLMNNVPQALQQLAQPTKSIWPFDQLSELWKAISPHLSPLSNIVSMLNNHVSMTNSGVSMASTLHSMLKGFAPAAAQAVETAAQNGVQAMSSLGSQLGSSLGSSGLGAGVAANLGRAASVGSLSVPQAWAAANQAVTPAARALPLTSLTSAAQTAPGHMLGGLPLGHSVNAGSGINNALRVPARAYAILRTPAAG
ncbi:transmembrane protein [Mycobacterium tuberculosis]|nr:transmembrane protein [Mycobacterium tuberculosis]